MNDNFTVIKLLRNLKLLGQIPVLTGPTKLIIIQNDIKIVLLVDYIISLKNI